MTEKIAETTPPGRITLPSESASTLAPPEVTHSGDVSRLEPTTAMVLRSQARGGRSSVAIGNPVEIPVSVYACESGLSTTGPTVVESVSSQIGTYPVRPKNKPNIDLHTTPGTHLDSHTASLSAKRRKPRRPKTLKAELKTIESPKGNR